MIKNYYRFDVDKFFRDYKWAKKRKRQLEAEKKAILSEGGMDYSVPKVSGGMPGDMVSRKAVKRQEIDDKLDELNDYFRLYDLIMAEMEEQEKEFIKVYFYGDKFAAWERTAEAMSMNKATVYNKLKDIRHKVSDIADFETLF